MVGGDRFRGLGGIRFRGQVELGLEGRGRQVQKVGGVRFRGQVELGLEGWVELGLQGRQS